APVVRILTGQTGADVADALHGSTHDVPGAARVGFHQTVPQSTGGRATWSPTLELATCCVLRDSHTNKSTKRRPASLSGRRTQISASLAMSAFSTPTPKKATPLDVSWARTRWAAMRIVFSGSPSGA